MLLPTTNSSLPQANGRHFWWNNRWFFALYLPLLLTGFGLLFFLEHGDEILYINARGTTLLNTFFRAVTRLAEEEAYLFWAAALALVRYRTAILVPIIGISAGLLSAVGKVIFGAPRPLLYFKYQLPELLGQLNLMEDFHYNAGSNSFPSGHTISAFALYGLLAFSNKNKTLSTGLLLTLAILVSISRVYLLQHFLRDILMGSVLGVLLAVFLYRIQFRYFPQPHPWLDNGLLRKRYLPGRDDTPPVKIE